MCALDARLLTPNLPEIHPCGLRVSIVHSVLLPSGVSLHGCITVYLSSHLLVNIWLVCVFSVVHKDAMHSIYCLKYF